MLAEMLQQERFVLQSYSYNHRTIYAPVVSTHRAVQVLYNSGVDASNDSVYLRAGMDFYVVLDRAGYRVAKRRQRLAKVGVQHRVTKEDAIKWFQTKFEGIVHNKANYN